MAESDSAAGCAAAPAGRSSGISSGADRRRKRRLYARAGGIPLQSNGRASWRDRRNTVRLGTRLRRADNASPGSRRADDAASGELYQAHIRADRESFLLRESDSHGKALCNGGRKVDEREWKALRARDGNVYRHRAP